MYNTYSRFSHKHPFPWTPPTCFPSALHFLCLLRVNSSSLPRAPGVGRAYILLFFCWREKRVARFVTEVKNLRCPILLLRRRYVLSVRARFFLISFLLCPFFRFSFHFFVCWCCSTIPPGRLSTLVRGVGDPMVAVYCRCFIAAAGAKIAPRETAHAVASLQDYLFSLQARMVTRADVTYNSTYQLNYDTTVLL